MNFKYPSRRMRRLAPLTHRKDTNSALRRFWLGGAYEHGHDLPDCPALGAIEVNHALDTLRPVTAAPTTSLCCRMGVA